jgi:hypothetical protein
MAWVRKRAAGIMQVLSDPDTRKIYDVYGRLGLKAGMEVGAKYKSLEELRAQWQEFQAHMTQQRVAAEIAPSTRIAVSSSAVPLLRSFNTEGGSCFVPLLGFYYEPIWPMITQAAVVHQCSFQVTSKCTLALGGARRLLHSPIGDKVIDCPTNACRHVAGVRKFSAICRF